jgi:hypothetical protein
MGTRQLCQRRHAEDAEDGAALGGHDLVDVAALGGKHKHAEHRSEALDRHRHRDDQVALLAHPDDGRRAAGERRHDLRIGRAIAARLLVIDGQVAPTEEADDALLQPFEEVGLLLFHGRQVVAKDLTLGIEPLRIKQEIGVAIVNAGAGARRRDQASQERRDDLRIDGEIQVVELV